MYNISGNLRKVMLMPHSRIAGDEISRRGKELYETNIRKLVELPPNIGKQIMIDIETGEYAIDDDRVIAARVLNAKHPDAALYCIRIGYNAVYSIGGTLTRTYQP